MAERGALIDKDQVADDRRQALSEFARRRRRWRHRQMRRPVMTAGLAESVQEQQSRQHQISTATSGGDLHRIAPRETSMNHLQHDHHAKRTDYRAQQQVAAEHDIEAQLARLNELRLHDELSRSAGHATSAPVAGQSAPRTPAARMRMITSQAEMPPQQRQEHEQPLTQQQRAAELDDRLGGGGGAGAVVVATTTAEYNRDQPPPLPAQHHSLQQQLPHLVEANQYQHQQQVDHHHHHQHHNHLLSAHHPNQYQQHHHDHQYNTHGVAFYSHNLQQQQQQRPQVDYHLLEEPPDAPLTSLLDLDEGTHHHSQRGSYSARGQHELRVAGKQEAALVGLPESVIRVNDWSERRLSACDQFYAGSSGSGCRLERDSRAGSCGAAQLTTLNSAAAASTDRAHQPHLVHHAAAPGQPPPPPPSHHQHQHRRGDSTSSFNLSTNSTISMPGGSLAFGRELDAGYSSTGALVAPGSSTSQLLPVAHDLYQEAEDEDDDGDGDAEPQRSRNSNRTRARTSHRASGHHHRRRQAAGTPPGSDDADELKVCEWHGCGNSFLDMKDFVRHLEERHVNMEPVEKNRFFCMWADCKRNNQEFNARYKLLIHMRVHSGEKPFTCDQSPYCKKSFSRLENLKIHKRSHTGEKPYRCNYEHCSKSFTNSSDRIKHHKTHKDPKPYTCTHDGCTKRYTDPSSLRKHLRAHKRHSDGPEAINHGHLYSSSSAAAAAAHLYHPGPHHQDSRPFQPSHSQHQELSFSASYQTAREHITPPQLQPDQSRMPDDSYAQQQQYSFDQQQQPAAYGADSYATLDSHSKQMYDQQPAHQVYLQADYDPTKELESVLSGASINAHDQLSSSFRRPQQQQQSEHRTDSTAFGHSGQPEQQQQQQHARYLTVPPGQQHILSARSPAQQRVSEAQARQHERLSRSWCVGNSARPAPTARRQHLAPESALRSRMDDGAGSSSQHPYHIKQTPDSGPQAVVHEWPAGGAPPTSAGWARQQNHNQQVAAAPSQGATFTPYSTPAYQTMQQQPPVEAEHWPASSHYDEPHSTVAGGRAGQRVQFQQEFQPHHQQQQPRQLSRQQQHEQLMRSMPANVNL